MSPGIGRVKLSTFKAANTGPLTHWTACWTFYAGKLGQEERANRRTNTSLLSGGGASYKVYFGLIPA
jgi:hypothetical protein